MGFPDNSVLQSSYWSTFSICSIRSISATRSIICSSVSSCHFNLSCSLLRCLCRKYFSRHLSEAFAVPYIVPQQTTTRFRHVEFDIVCLIWHRFTCGMCGLLTHERKDENTNSTTNPTHHPSARFLRSCLVSLFFVNTECNFCFMPMQKQALINPCCSTGTSSSSSSPKRPYSGSGKKEPHTSVYISYLKSGGDRKRKETANNYIRK